MYSVLFFKSFGGNRACLPVYFVPILVGCQDTASATAEKVKAAGRQSTMIK